MASLASAARGNYVGEESGHLDDILGKVRKMGFSGSNEAEAGLTIHGIQSLRAPHVPRKIRGNRCLSGQRYLANKRKPFLTISLLPSYRPMHVGEFQLQTRTLRSEHEFGKGLGSRTFRHSPDPRLLNGRYVDKIVLILFDFSLHSRSGLSSLDMGV